MESYLEIWMEWRKQETSVSKKTIKENRFLWNALLKDQDITLIELRSLSAKDLIIFFRNITKGRQLTRKRFNDLKSIMNGLLYLAVENGVEDTELQRLLGHTCLTMTHHYLRNITSQDETASKMRAILD